MPPAVSTAVRTNLKATVIPTSLMRATILGNFMKNFDFPDDTIAICQQGYADGLIAGVTIKGLAYDGHIEDEATLLFDELVHDVEVSVDISSGRSMIEAASVKLAHAVSYSIATMKRKGLSLSFSIHFTPRVNADAALAEQVCARFNLVYSRINPTYRPGYGPRRLFEVRPGLDKGIRYSHSSARRTR